MVSQKDTKFEDADILPLEVRSITTGVTMYITKWHGITIVALMDDTSRLYNWTAQVAYDDSSCHGTKALICAPSALHITCTAGHANSGILAFFQVHT